MNSEAVNFARKLWKKESEVFQFVWNNYTVMNPKSVVMPHTDNTVLLLARSKGLRVQNPVFTNISPVRIGICFRQGA